MEDKIITIEKETTDLTVKAQDCVIASQEQYNGAANFLKLIKGLQQKIKDTFDPIVSAANKTHKAATAKRSEHLAPALAAEKLMKGKLIAYQIDQERIRLAEEKRLADMQRKEAERLARRAERAEEKGKIEKAHELAEQAQQTEALKPVVASKVEKVAGITTKKVWKYRIIDETIVPRRYLMLDTAKIGAEVRLHKKETEILGVKAYSEDLIAA